MRSIIIAIPLFTLAAHGQYVVEGRYLHRTGSTNTYTITSDANGNILVGGQVDAQTDFHPGDPLGTLDVVGTNDGYLCKLDPSGTFLWAVAFNANETYTDWLQDAVTDEAGNIYAVGVFGGTTDFDPGAGVAQVNGGEQDGYLVKLSPDGDLLWVKDVGAGGADGLFGAALSDNGDIIVSGYVEAGATIDNNTILLDNSQRAGLVASFRPDGTFNWARTMPGGQSRNVTDVRVGPDGGIHGCGIFSGTLDLDPGAAQFLVTSAGNADGFYFKLDAAGTLLWGGRVGGALEDWCYDLDVDAGGATYLAGHFRDVATIANGAATLDITAGSTSDALIARIAADGTPAWAHGIPGNGRSHTVCAAPGGDVVYNGYFSNTVDFDPGPGAASLTTLGGNDMFVARYTSGGDFVEVLTIASPSGQLGRGMHVNDAGVVFAAGSSGGALDLDPGPGILADTAASESSFYVRLEAMPITGIADRAAEPLLHPNPLRNGDVLNTGHGAGRVRIVDDTGRTVAEPGTVVGNAALVLELPPGSYLLEWSDGRMRSVRRFAVVR